MFVNYCPIFTNSVDWNVQLIFIRKKAPVSMHIWYKVFSRLLNFQLVIRHDKKVTDQQAVVIFIHYQMFNG